MSGIPQLGFLKQLLSEGAIGKVQRDEDPTRRPQKLARQEAIVTPGLMGVRRGDGGFGAWLKVAAI